MSAQSVAPFKRRALSTATALSLSAAVMAPAMADLPVVSFQRIVQPRANYSLDEPVITSDDRGTLTIAYTRGSTRTGAEMLYLSQVDDRFSAPAKLDLGLDNDRELMGLTTLSSGSVIAALSTDDTDYLALLGVNDPTDPLPISDDELERWMSANQRVFYMLQVDGKWASPLPIPDTFHPMHLSMAAGPNETAIIAYVRDMDDNEASRQDREVFTVTYQNNEWSAPVRLTTNNRRENYLTTTWANGGFTVAWAVDMDDDSGTQDDKRIYAAGIGPNNAIVAPIQQIGMQFTAPSTPAPMLGRDGGDAVLLWATDIEADDNPTRPLMQSRLSAGAWSPPTDTGVRIYGSLNNDLFPIAGGLLLVYEESGGLRAAFLSGGRWSDRGSILDFNKLDLVTVSLEFHYRGGANLDVVVLGYVKGSLSTPTAGQQAAGAVVDDQIGMYFAQVPVAPDLEIVDIEGPNPIDVVKGKTVAVNIVVQNAGVVKSGEYDLSTTDGDNLISVIHGGELDPGEIREHKVDVDIEGLAHVISARIDPDGLDGDIGNNQLDTTLRIRPDYEVVEITQISDRVLQARVGDKQNTGGPPVTVDMFLVDGPQRVLLDSRIYDPSLSGLIEFQVDALVDRDEPAHVEARINDSRDVLESEYANNIFSFVYDPRADVEIEDARLIDQNTLRLTIINHGAQPVAELELLVTDDVEIAGIGEIPRGGGRGASFGAPMGGANRYEIDLDIGDQFDRDYLYVVANTDRAVPESNWNNNTERIPNRPLENGKANLSILVVNACFGVETCIHNYGDGPSISSSLELLDDQGVVIDERSFGTIKAQETACLTFPGLANGHYSIRHSYFRDGDRLQSEANFEIVEDCDGDGLDNADDNCGDDANADQEDVDNDGIGSACDPDNDNDGVDDFRDNCPWDANEHQIDTDEDDHGDVCDDDDDNDGLADTEDNCRLVSNPDQTDRNGDGVGDDCIHTFERDGNGAVVSGLDWLVQADAFAGVQDQGDPPADPPLFDHRDRARGLVLTALVDSTLTGYAGLTAAYMAQAQAAAALIIDSANCGAAHVGTNGYCLGQSLMGLGRYGATGGPDPGGAGRTVREAIDIAADNLMAIQAAGGAYANLWGYSEDAAERRVMTHYAAAGLAAARGYYIGINDAGADSVRARIDDALDAAANAVIGGINVDGGLGYEDGDASSYPHTAGGLLVAVLGGAHLDQASVQSLLRWLQVRYQYETVDPYDADQPENYYHYLWASAVAYRLLEASGMAPAMGNIATTGLGTLNPSTPPIDHRVGNRNPSVDGRVPERGAGGGGYYAGAKAGWDFDYRSALMHQQTLDGIFDGGVHPQHEDGNPFIDHALAVLVMHGAVSGACVDSDGDRVCDVDDNCAGDVNPGQADTDGDGTGDACDTCAGERDSAAFGNIFRGDTLCGGACEGNNAPTAACLDHIVVEVDQACHWQVALADVDDGSTDADGHPFACRLDQTRGTDLTVTPIDLSCEDACIEHGAECHTAVVPEDNLGPRVDVTLPIFQAQLQDGWISNWYALEELCGIEIEDNCSDHAAVRTGIVDITSSDPNEVIEGNPGYFHSEGVLADWFGFMVNFDRNSSIARTYTVSYAAVDEFDNWTVVECRLELTD